MPLMPQVPFTRLREGAGTGSLRGVQAIHVPSAWCGYCCWRHVLAQGPSKDVL